MQLLGNEAENITIKFWDRRWIFHPTCGFELKNNNDFPPFPLTIMQENDYDCDIRWAWDTAYWVYIALFLFNGFFYFCGTSIWHTIGITMGFQMIVYYPLWMNWPPSCLSYFLVWLKLSLGQYLDGPLIETLEAKTYL